MARSKARADGVVGPETSLQCLIHHPVRSFKGASRYFLMSRPPLLASYAWDVSFYWTQGARFCRFRGVKVCGQEFSDETIRRIQTKVAEHRELTRSALSREVCEWLDWRTKKGKLKQVSCRVALGRLERQGVIRLPAAQPFANRGIRRSKVGRVAQVPWTGKLDKLQPIELIRIGGAGSRASQHWSALMEQHHYLGAGPLCGAQLRYLVHSPHYGYIGGLAFSSAAWRLEARDQWIGWSDRTRRENLPRVIANSRFLIVPCVRAPNLASHVLSLALRRIRSDWMARYGEDPLLVETFVEKQRYRGTCYQAGNWITVGETKGRGRQDRNNQHELPVKKVLLYPLVPDVRERLCEGDTVADSEPVQRPAASDWAEEEFGQAQLGDQRLTQRLVSLARDFAANPQAQVPQACQSQSKTKAAYRFFDHPRTTMEDLLEPHYQSTIHRMGEHRVVLAVQDTTSLNYTMHPQTNGIGPIGSKKTGGPIGLMVHDTMGFSVEGTPLGLIDVQCWARDGKTFGKSHQRRDKPIEQKESYKWLKSFQAAAQAQRQCPDTVVVSVGDREADIYELFHLALEDPKGPKLLVRAEQNRLLADGQGHLWSVVTEKPVAAIQHIRIPRRNNAAAREAQLELRFAEVRLHSPGGKRHLPELTLWAVLIQEIDAPADVTPLRWMLLTTCAVNDAYQAIEKVDWYSRRWGIEVYHRTLKSGCKIEERQFASAYRIEACLALDMVVAWRVYHLVGLGRETPDVSCTVFFQEHEWKALCTHINHDPVPPAQPPDLRTATRMVATLGGFLGRKGDGEPGTKHIWLGLQHLDDLAAMWLFMATNYAPHLLSRPVSRAPT